MVKAQLAFRKAISGMLQATGHPNKQYPFLVMKKNGSERLCLSPQLFSFPVDSVNISLQVKRSNPCRFSLT